MLLVCFVAGCATEREAPVPAEQPSQPADFPAAFYQEPARAAAVHRINSEASQVVMRVYRGGSLARFGHDHVIASRDVHGYVYWPNDLREARGDLYVPIATFSIDEPALRARAGLETQPSQSDIEGTRRNMRAALEAQAHPFVTLHVIATAGEGRQYEVQAAVTLHGVTRQVPVTAEWDNSNGPTFYLTGRFSVNQTDFGIKPFSFMGGALQVQDKVDIEFDLSLSPIQR